MRRRLVGITVVAALLLVAAPMVQAITFGQPDGSLHPNVGAMVVEFSAGEMGIACSGTLIAPQVFLTAAHCTNWLPSAGLMDNVYVSFDPVITASSTLFHGTVQLNPSYGHDHHDPNDVAVILLDTAPPNIVPAQLPAAGLLDQMKDEHLLKDQTFVAVGYGATRDKKTGAWHYIDWDNSERWYVEQGFEALKPAWIQLSMNPATGNGGTCYGDSGGPHFLAGTNVVVALTVTGDAWCRATDVDYRLDTESARSFLGQFVTLP
jgi:secreted trypsin-like serine protease